MDCRATLVLFVTAIVTLLVLAEGRTKKVVIHVPYKVKRIKHVHTVYKTIHHHHHDGLEHQLAPSEEHEHFHHMHHHDEGQHSQPVPGFGIPDFLPDVPLPDLPDMPRELPILPSRHVPLFRRT